MAENGLSLGGDISPVVVYSATERIRHYSVSQNIQLLLAWAIITGLATYEDTQILRLASPNWVLLSLPFAGLILAVIFRLIIAITPLYTLAVRGVENLIYGSIILYLISQTGGTDSIFIFFLFGLPVLANAKGWFISPLSQSIFEAVGVILISSYTLFSMTDPLSSLLKIVMIALSLLFVGAVSQTIKAKLREIEEEKQFEETKIAREEQILIDKKNNLDEVLDNILGSIKEGVIATGSNGQVTLVSRKAIEILKTSSIVVKGKSIREVLPISDKTPKDKNGAYQLQFTSLDAEPMIVSVNIFPIKTHMQEVNGNIYVLKDITQETNFESMRLDFVSTAAHQLRTPLTSMKGYLSMLQKSVIENGAKLNDQESLYLARSITSTNHLSALIENLLSITKIERGALKVDWKPIVLEDLITSTAQQLADRAHQEQISLRLGAFKPPYTMVLGDANLLASALSNLIENGIEFNHPGGFVSIELSKENNMVTVHVTDNGKGIAANVVPHLFTQFYRANDSLTQNSDGAGLGLYITKAIIEAHKGRIGVNSIEGKGTTISFTLPAAPLSFLAQNKVQASGNTFPSPTNNI